MVSESYILGELGRRQIFTKGNEGVLMILTVDYKFYMNINTLKHHRRARVAKMITLNANFVSRIEFSEAP